MTVATEEAMVRRLSAGGELIRNFSSALPSVVSRVSETLIRAEHRLLPRNRVRNGLAAGYPPPFPLQREALLTRIQFPLGVPDQRERSFREALTHDEVDFA